MTQAEMHTLLDETLKEHGEGLNAVLAFASRATQPLLNGEMAANGGKGVEPGAVVWYVPENARSLNDVVLGVVTNEISSRDGAVWVLLFSGGPAVLIDRNRLKG